MASLLSTSVLSMQQTDFPLYTKTADLCGVKFTEPLLRDTRPQTNRLSYAKQELNTHLDDFADDESAEVTVLDACGPRDIRMPAQTHRCKQHSEHSKVLDTVVFFCKQNHGPCFLDICHFSVVGHLFR